MKKILGLLLVCLSLSAPAAGFAAQQQMIVKLKSGSALAEKAEKRLLGGKLLLITADPAQLTVNPDVEWFEPNLAIHGTMGGANPINGVDKNAWGVKQIAANDLWIEGRTGKNVIVAVLDSGVASDHPALAKKLIEGWNAIAGNKKTEDDHGHGTHVAGVIAGDKIGVAPDAIIMPVKVLDGELGGTVATAVSGIEFAVKHGAKVICSSWIADGFSQALYDAIKEAQAAGIVFVTGAGNGASNNDTISEYPASYDLDNIISVAATDPDDKLTSGSNFGVTTVHVAAPGLNIYSSVLDKKYDYYSGTSMAAAHVAGIAAIMAQQGIKNMRQKIMATSDAKPNLKVIAHGRVNAFKAAHSAPFED